MGKNNYSGILVSQYIVKNIENHQLIENADIPNCVKPASYELRIGSYSEMGASVDLPVGKGIAIAPWSFLLIGTMETVNLPLDIIGMLYLRSTYARSGFVSWFQGIVDPGYSGSLTFVLHNHTDSIIPIYGGERVCHLIFQKLPEPADRPYDGVYQKSEGATPARYYPALKVVGQVLSDVGRTAVSELIKHPEVLKGTGHGG